MKRLTILPYPKWVGNKELTTQKTSIKRVFVQFSRYRFETSQVRLSGTGRKDVDDSTIPPYASGMKDYSLKKRKFDLPSLSFQDTDLKLHRYISDSATPRYRSWRV